MKTTVAIVGAGGKMGSRAASKIGLHSQYRVLMCESHAEKAQRLVEEGFTVLPLETALQEADFVVLAVPDAAIGRISHTSVPLMKRGATLIMLDAAAAYIREIPSRAGITQMITHPCHPALFAEQPKQKTRDYFGGNAVQDIIVALIEGSSDSFAAGTELSKVIFAPVGRSHEVSAEQFALLEPAMSEIIVATAAVLIKSSLDEVISKGVSQEAAWAFLKGHAQIALAMALGFEKSPFSDAAKIAIEWGTNEILRPDWKKVFDRPVLERAIHVMLHPDHKE